MNTSCSFICVFSNIQFSHLGYLYCIYFDYNCIIFIICFICHMFYRPISYVLYPFYFRGEIKFIFSDDESHLTALASCSKIRQSQSLNTCLGLIHPQKRHMCPTHVQDTCFLKMFLQGTINDFSRYMCQQVSKMFSVSAFIYHWIHVSETCIRNVCAIRVSQCIAGFKVGQAYFQTLGCVVFM